MLRRLVCNRNPAVDLPDDLIVEILSRLPAKSICRFKCVSRHWLHGLIISHPYLRAKLAQMLTGFFRHNNADSDYDSDNNIVPDYLSMGEYHQACSPSFSVLLLPRGLYRSVLPKHCSNGLVLCLCSKVSPSYEFDYVVCNPATQQYVTLPSYGHRDPWRMPLYLASDPASACGHFHLFALLGNHHRRYDIDAVDIYSSKTGAWSHKEVGWTQKGMAHQHSVFLDDMIHFVTINNMIVAVDTKGSSWKTIPSPAAMDSDRTIYTSLTSFIGVSQGRLQYVNNRPGEYYTLSLWVRDDDKWINRYNISTTQIFGANSFRNINQYLLVAIHPECNTIFFTVRGNNKFMSYDMDHGEARVLGVLVSPHDGFSRKPYLPYAPSWRSIA
uniref:Uncharacterized protein n=1 Tax=Avena sativa TaxID=4498 RepID=A0ACD5W900_AVESA